MAIVGYARVSTRDQDLAGQLAELKAAGCELVYREKVSGAASDRKELARLVRKLERGDTVIVTRLDRLARSTRDLLNILDEIGKAGAGFRSIKDTWADTTTSHGRLMLTILGELAEFERELIKDRTDAGRVRAKARGVKFGRKPKLNPFQREQAWRGCLPARRRLRSLAPMAWIGRPSAGWPRRSLSRRAPRFPETEGPAPMTVPRAGKAASARIRQLGPCPGNNCKITQFPCPSSFQIFQGRHTLGARHRTGDVIDQTSASSRDRRKSGRCCRHPSEITRSR